MKTQLGLFFTSILMTFTTLAADGVIKKRSNFPVSETADRFERMAEEKQLSVFTRIDHAENARHASLTLRPTETVVFGNPKVGTPLMQCAPSVAIDLPQKALIWQDDDGQVWFAYNDPAYLKKRHAITGCNKQLDKIATVLDSLSDRVTQQ